MNSVRSGCRLSVSLKVERVLVGARNVWRQRGKKGKKAKLPINFSVRWEAVSSYLDLAVCKKKKYNKVQH